MNSPPIYCWIAVRNWSSSIGLFFGSACAFPSKSSNYRKGRKGTQNWPMTSSIGDHPSALHIRRWPFFILFSLQTIQTWEGIPTGSLPPEMVSIYIHIYTYIIIHWIYIYNITIFYIIYTCMYVCVYWNDLLFLSTAPVAFPRKSWASWVSARTTRTAKMHDWVHHFLAA